MNPLIVSVSGIRGVVGQTMTPELASRYGAAFGQFLTESGSVRPGSWVLLGRDSRTSGSVLAAAAAAGVRATGVDVRDAGIAPTPTLLLSVADTSAAAGAIVVTASHNPIEWNGLKLAGANGRFVTPAGGERIQEIVQAGPAYRGWDGLGAADALAGVLQHHVDRILELPFVRADRIAQMCPLVAVDCVRGAGGTIMPNLLAALGCRVVGLGLEPDGRFPRNPEPTAENLNELADLVRETGADLGLALDPDGDRLSLVDGRGVPVGEDWTLALAAEYVLSQRPGPVVTNLSSSQSIEDAARRAGVTFHRTAVGEARVAAKMVEIDASIGGEGNGGVMLPGLSLTRDAPAAAALILSLLASERTSLEDHLRGRTDYRMAKRKLPLPSGDAARAYRALEAALPGAELDRSDGLRLAWREAGEWIHVRPSGTEPAFRIIAEAPSAERAEALADRAEECLSAES